MREVFVLGDSISMHYGPFLKAMLEGVFRYDRKGGAGESLIDLEKPAGANGGDSSVVLAYLQWLRDGGRKLDILLVNCGLHDIRTDPLSGAKQIPPDKYFLNLERIINLSLSLSNQMIWIRTTDAQEHIHNERERTVHRFHADVAAYNEMADKVMKSRGIPIIDLYRFTRTFGEEAFCDHVHYAEPVRRQQAAFLAGYIEGRFA